MRAAIVLAVCTLAPSLFIACADEGKGLGSSHGYGDPSAAGVGDTPEADHDATQSDPGVNASAEEAKAAETAPTAPSGPAQTTGSFKATVSNATPQSDLGEKVSFDVTIEAQAGFAGKVDLTAEKLPTGVTALFEPAQVDVPATGSAKAKLTLSTAVDVVPATTEISIKGKSGAQEASVPANLKVNNVITMRVPVNIDAMRKAGAATVDVYGAVVGADGKVQGGVFGEAPKPIGEAGKKLLVKVQNLDSTPHIIHSSGEFGHGDNGNPIAKGGGYELAGGAPRMRSLSSGTTSTGYLHEGTNGTSVGWKLTTK